MGKFKINFKPYGDQAILIEWPQVISKEILFDINNYEQKVKDNNIKSILEVNSIYNSILILYDIECDLSNLINSLHEIYNEDSEVIRFNRKVWEIPVCYQNEFGLDLKLISSEISLEIDEVISLHTSCRYTVFGIGFLPGFLYLGVLSKKLHFPRREAPRLIVPRGAVGIGGIQTGIYPQASPGGWNIIGNTPVKLFDVNEKPPTKISSGDEIQFKSVSIEEYKNIEEMQDVGIYELGFSSLK